MNSYYIRIIIYLFFFIGAEVIYTVFKYNYSLSKMFNVIYPYFYLLLSPAILKLLKKDGSFFLRLIKFILIATTISIAMRILLSLYWGATGKYIFGDMAFEFNDGSWIRNNRLRVNMPCFVFYYIPLLTYYYSQEIRKTQKNIILAVGIALFAYYLAFIIQARSLLFYSVAIFVFVQLMERGVSLRKVVTIAIVTVGLFVFINSSYFEKLYFSIFNSGTEMGGSIFERFRTVNYFWNRFLENPLFGIGLLNNEDLHSKYFLGHISDIGITGSVFRLGIQCGVLYFFYLWRWFSISRKIRKYSSSESCLVLACCCSALLNGINTDFMYGSVIFSVPIISALFEYIYRFNIIGIVDSGGIRNVVN